MAPASASRRCPPTIVKRLLTGKLACEGANSSSISAVNGENRLTTSPAGDTSGPLWLQRILLHGSDVTSRCGNKLSRNLADTRNPSSCQPPPCVGTGTASAQNAGIHGVKQQFSTTSAKRPGRREDFDFGEAHPQAAICLDNVATRATSHDNFADVGVIIVSIFPRDAASLQTSSRSPQIVPCFLHCRRPWEVEWRLSEIQVAAKLAEGFSGQSSCMGGTPEVQNRGTPRDHTENSKLLSNNVLSSSSEQRHTPQVAKGAPHGPAFILELIALLSKKGVDFFKNTSMFEVDERQPEGTHC